MKRIIGEKTIIGLKALFQASLVLVIFFHFFKLQDNYRSAIQTHRIKNKMENVVSRCGKDYFVSWIVLDSQKLRGRYYFKDVIGCNPFKPSLDCAYSVKDLKLNPFYNQEHHKVDSKSYDFLNSMDVGVAAFYKDTVELEKFATIKEILQSTNKKINNVGISVTKDSINNLVFVFTLANTGISNKCGQQETVDSLEEISIFAKEGI